MHHCLLPAMRTQSELSSVTIRCQNVALLQHTHLSLFWFGLAKPPLCNAWQLQDTSTIGLPCLTEKLSFLETRRWARSLITCLIQSLDFELTKSLRDVNWFRHRCFWWMWRVSFSFSYHGAASNTHYCFLFENMNGFRGRQKKQISLGNKRRSHRF